MKKTFLLLIAGMLMTCLASAQTYCYKILYNVDAETGVKSEASGVFYITFTKNKTSCYESDADGYAIKGDVMQSAGDVYSSFIGYRHEKSDGIYRLQSSSSEILTYRCVIDVSQNPLPFMMGSTYTNSKEYKHIAFSCDYSRVNVGLDKVTVAERVIKPGATPANLY